MNAITTPGQLQVIKRTGDVAAFDAEKISVAIGKAFQAIEYSTYHAETVYRYYGCSFESYLQFNQFINKYFIKNLFSLSGSLKLTKTSEAISVFKKLKQITATIIFSSTRNFSIQKNLSISA